ncbi:hypothetical protein D3C73_1650430 [compost metagenome]
MRTPLLVRDLRETYFRRDYIGQPCRQGNRRGLGYLFMRQEALSEKRMEYCKSMLKHERTAIAEVVDAVGREK